MCLLGDSRELDTCASTGAGGLTVRLGTSTAVTDDNGSFMIAASNATAWIVTGTNIVTSLKRVGDYEIPAITRTMFTSMVSTNISTNPPNPGEGHVIAQVIQNGAPPVTSAFAEAVPTATWGPFYDGADATHWQQAGTGGKGAVWIPSIDVGTINLKFSLGAKEVNVQGLPIQDGAITFVTVIFP